MPAGALAEMVKKAIPSQPREAGMTDEDIDRGAAERKKEFETLSDGSGKALLDEIKGDIARIEELEAKANRTEEEEAELQELLGKYADVAGGTPREDEQEYADDGGIDK